MRRKFLAFDPLRQPCSSEFTSLLSDPTVSCPCPSCKGDMAARLTDERFRAGVPPRRPPAGTRGLRSGRRSRRLGSDRRASRRCPHPEPSSVRGGIRLHLVRTRGSNQVAFCARDCVRVPGHSWGAELRGGIASPFRGFAKGLLHHPLGGGDVGRIVLLDLRDRALIAEKSFARTKTATPIAIRASQVPRAIGWAVASTGGNPNTGFGLYAASREPSRGCRAPREPARRRPPR